MKVRYIGPLLVLALLVGAFVPSSVSARMRIAYWFANRTKAYYNVDFVGIGTDNPTSNLHVTGLYNGADILTADPTEVRTYVPLVSGDDFTVEGTLLVSTNAGGGPVATFQNLDNGDGIDIQVANGSPNTGNNFVSFLNSGGGTVGRIEGETLAEILTSFDYIWATTFETLGTLFQVAIVIADIAGLDDGDAAIIEGFELVNYIANWVALQNELLGSPGCAFESGSGDYAEWLEKSDPRETFSPGDVVGVRAGKISKDTSGADHYMVISKSPIVLGNMPPEGRKPYFEKVAFMGQVGVKVAGSVRKGDYILPSKRNDGFAIAVHPDDMTLPDYERIVGVAWSESATGLSYINTAVGINANDLVARMIRQQEEIEAVKGNMNAVVGYLQAKDPSFTAEIFDVDPVAARAEEVTTTYVSMTRQERMNRVADVLRQNPEMVEAIQADAREILLARGIEFDRYEQTQRILTDPSYLLDILEGYDQR